MARDLADENAREEAAPEPETGAEVELYRQERQGVSSQVVSNQVSSSTSGRIAALSQRVVQTAALSNAVAAEFDNNSLGSSVPVSMQGSRFSDNSRPETNVEIESRVAARVSIMYDRGDRDEARLVRVGRLAA